MATGRVPTTANSPLTAKGDLFTYSTASARLAVGNNGESLVADSSTSTGLRYTAGTVQANPVLNSAFQIWQRGASIAAVAGNNAYTADRWMVYRQGVTGATVTRQVTGDTTNLPNIQYCARVQRDSGNTSINVVNIANNFESVNSIPYAGKTVTISAYVRKGTNYSSASDAFSLGIATGTGTDQTLNVTGYTGAAYPVSASATLTTTWQRISATGTLAATATELAVYAGYTPVGTAGAADYFEVTGVQIDIGSVALPFRTYAATLQGELAACQRYYYRATPGTSSYGLFSFWGNATSATNLYSIALLPTTMRTNPSVIDFSTLRVFGQSTGVYNAISAVALDANSTTLQSVGFNITSTGMTTNSVVGYGANGSTSAYIGFSAEL